MRTVMDWANAAYSNQVVANLIHTTPACLRKVLRDCSSVLDLGSGARSPVPAACDAWTLGVEFFEPSVLLAHEQRTHDCFVRADLTKVEFAAGCVDVVVMLEVLEHLAKADGAALLDRAERWARRRVVVSTPNGFLPQAALEGNPYQEHLSGWEISELQERGYRAHGLAGLKQLRKENDHDVVQSDRGAMLASIRFRPRAFWLGVSGLSQVVTYHLPRWAFEVLYVRDVG